MKRFLSLMMVVLLTIWQGQAVLKEKDLSRTLGVLRAELQNDYKRMQQYMQMYEQQGEQQHKQLVNYMNQCEQISLMLYSQSTDNTFDMAYACQQATSLYRELHGEKGNMLPYAKILKNMEREIERYDHLIKTLKNMPPIITEDGDSATATRADSASTLIYQVIDSLQQANDSIRAMRDSVHRADSAKLQDAKPKDAPKKEEKEAEESEEPLYLTGQELEDRKACLEYAQSMHEMLVKFHDSMEAESQYYEAVSTKMEDLNKFAKSRYNILKDNIFKNKSDNYLTVLKSLPNQVRRLKMSMDTKYKPFEGHSNTYSEWRGGIVLFVSVFIVFYLAIAFGISYGVLRFLMPKRWRSEKFKLRRQMLSMIGGIALFVVFVMMVRTHATHNLLQMGTGIVINMAWLLEVIFVSLYIRLKGEQMRYAVILYMPLMVMSFIVILFRVVLVPNILVNLIFPPILLGFTIWQVVASLKHANQLPTLDRVYTHLTSLIMVICTVLAWAGYSLMAVQVMIWWTFQLAAIMTVTCFYDLTKMYETQRMVYKVAPALRDESLKAQQREEQTKAVLREMLKGKHFTRTWLYDLVRMVIIPIMAVASVLLSIIWAGSTFDMTDPFIEVWRKNFINQEGLIQLSIEKICVVAALWFVFRYINYAIFNTYTYFRSLTLKEGQTLNATLASNIIAILVWGLFLIIAMVVFQVPSSGISIVSAGLATGVGFAMQSIIENFFYGLQLMAGRLRVGDFIECDGITGKVDNISYQSTQVITADGCVIAFMNSALFSKNFKNLTRNHHYELVKIPVGVAYGSDIDQVRQIILEAIQPLCQQRSSDGKRMTNPKTKPSVSFSDFGDSSVDLTVLVWMRVEDKLGLTARIKEAVYNALNKNGIEIPFPQRDVHVISQD